MWGSSWETAWAAHSNPRSHDFLALQSIKSLARNA